MTKLTDTALNDTEEATADELATVFLCVLCRLGDLGREGRLAIAKLVKEHQANEDPLVEEGLAQLEQIVEES